MFRGNHPTRVDEKGRLKVPSEFKREFDECYGAQCYITSVDGERAQIYPMPEWQKVEEKVAAMPSIPAKKKWLDRTSYYGQVAEMDAQGRVLIPQVLRESAKVNGEVVVFGKLQFLEVANHDLFKAKLDAEPMTMEDEAALAALGL
jgi:MraZ protein